jgi:hypothetical protein
LRFLDRELDSSLLVLLGVVARIPRQCQRLGDLRVHEVPVISFAAAVGEAGSFEVADQIADFSWHVCPFTRLYLTPGSLHYSAA